MKKQVRYFAADLETVVEDNPNEQTKTEAWSSAYVELFDSTERVYVDGHLEQTYQFFVDLKEHCVLYYHNLKFDGTFWVSMLLKFGYTFTRERKKMHKKQFSCSVSDMGQWYTVHFCADGEHIIELRDSAKLVPFKLGECHKAFKTKHQKLEMNYKGQRWAGCPITDEEMQYIKNDVLVLKEVLEFMFKDGHDKLTIGSCCIAEYKSKYDFRDYRMFFPNLKKTRLKNDLFGQPNADYFCREALRGGWTYLKPEFAGKVVRKGKTYDVNGLYSSVQHSMSGNYYPVGQPKWFLGRPPKAARENHHVYIVKIRCTFQLKKDHLPTLQIKNNPYYNSTEYLITSDVFYQGQYFKQIWQDGELVTYKPTLTLTNLDLDLLLEHYHVEDLEYIAGCWFFTELGLFDEYIDKYFEQKKTAKGAARTEAKLFLNNLWGKFSSSDDDSYKEPYLDDNGIVQFETHTSHAKKVLYAPVGIFTAAYARDFTIRHAQKNYDVFIYADTDSIHCLDRCDMVDIEEHPTNLLCWKCESHWDFGKFLHSKTYVEHCYKKDGEPCEPYWNVTCCGMPDNLKKNFMVKYAGKELEAFDEDLELDGKLMPRRIRGGIVLIETTFSIKANKSFLYR